MPASLELVKIALQAYANGDSEIALALSGPQVRWDERASRSDGDLVWGQDNVQRAMRRYLDNWVDYRFDVEDLAEVGPGKVVGICRERGKPKDGPAVDRRFGGLWIVEAGKITAWVTYLTPREAVRAAKELLGGRVELDQVKRSTGPAEVRPAEPVPAPQQPAPESIEAAEPIEATEPQPPERQASERQRKRPLTKSEEQKRAARARAKIRRLASRESA
jgi:ketosteroid isomerase-like protein